MAYYSPEYTKHDSNYECGYKNHICHDHAWVVDYNNVEQVEMMKDKVRELIKDAKEEVK